MTVLRSGSALRQMAYAGQHWPTMTELKSKAAELGGTYIEPDMCTLPDQASVLAFSQWLTNYMRDGAA